MENLKYSQEEILQILNDSYNAQVAFDPEVDAGAILTFDTTIGDWRIICDLLPTKKLAAIEHKIFQLDTPVTELEEILSQSNNTLKDFCTYISANALKEEIAAIKLFGQTCTSAAIYRTLIKNLTLNGVDTDNIRPSSKLKPLFYKDGGVWITEVNKLAPGSFSKFEYEENWISKVGVVLFLISIFSIITVSAHRYFHWTLLIPVAISIGVIVTGRKFKPKREIIGGYETVRDLITGMQLQIEKAPN